MTILNKQLSYWLTVILLSSMTRLSMAVITISPMLHTINYTDPRFYDIQIINMSKKDSAYINVSLYKQHSVLLDDNKWIKLAHNPVKFGFAVTPTKLILAPNQTQPVRLLILAKHYTKDIFVKVNITPVENPLIMIQPAKKKKDKQNTASGFQLVFAFNSIMILRPSHPHATIVLKRSGKHLTLSNTGNSYASFSYYKICKPNHQCQALTNKKLPRYLAAGQSVTVTLPYLGQVNVQKNFMGKKALIHST